MAGLVFLLVFWVLAGACQRHGEGGFLSCNSPSSSSRFFILFYIFSKKKKREYNQNAFIQA